MVVFADALVDDDFEVRAILEKTGQQGACDPGPRNRNARTALHLDSWQRLGEDIAAHRSNPRAGRCNGKAVDGTRKRARIPFK